MDITATITDIKARFAKVAGSTATDRKMRALFADIMRLTAEAKRAGRTAEVDAMMADLQAGH